MVVMIHVEVYVKYKRKKNNSRRKEHKRFGVVKAFRLHLYCIELYYNVFYREFFFFFFVRFIENSGVAAFWTWTFYSTFCYVFN